MTNSLFSHDTLSIARFFASLLIQCAKPGRPKYTAPKTLLLFIILATTHLVNGQAPVINCPSAAVILQDSTKNDSLFWAAIYDPQTPDITYNLHERASLIEFLATNPCPTGTLTFRYRLDLDLDNNGTPETRIHSTVVPPAGIVLAWNINTAFWAEEIFDNREVAPAQKWRFGLKTTPPNNAMQKAQIIWENTAGGQTYPMLPPGNHELTWYVKNQCEPEIACIFPLTIQAPVYQDTIPPTVSCANDLFINELAPFNGTLFNAIDLVTASHDDLTTSNLLRYGIRKSGWGTGFPFHNNIPQSSINLSCESLGNNTLEVWTMDESGNTSFCEMMVYLGDIQAYCHFSPGIYTEGAINTDESQGIEGVTIDFLEYSNPIPSIVSSISSSANGSYTLLSPFSSQHAIDIIPKLDTDPLNGITTWDLVLISRHILGLEPLSTPYKIIGADANKSGAVTTFDIVELRKLLLGTYTNLPNNNSWRFIYKNQWIFDNSNPFINDLMESIPIHYGSNEPGGLDFIGVKIGDMDNSAVVNNLLAIADRTAPFTDFNITRKDANNWLINEGDVVELSFSNPTPLSGYQMTLETNGLKPTEVTPGTGMCADNFALFDHAVTTVFEQGNAPFSVRFTAEESGDLRNMLTVSSKITPAMAFGENGEKMQVNLRFEGEKSSISPNPWTDHTRVSFHTSDASTATLKVFDMAGRLVYTTSKVVEKGEQAFELNTAQVPASGVLFYEITTKEGSTTGKSIKNNIFHH